MFFKNKDHDIKNKIIMCLTDDIKRSVREITEEIDENCGKVKEIIKELKLKGIMISLKSESKLKDKRYILNKNFNVFMSFAKELLSSSHSFDFISSNYLINMINEHLINHIESNYFIKLDEKLKDGILMLVKISPTALYNTLYYHYPIYETTYQHMKEIKISDDKREEWENNIISSYILKLLQDFLKDINNPNSKNSLLTHNVEGYQISIELKMANTDKLIMDLNSEATIMLLKAKGEIKAGQFVSASGSEVFIQVGGILLNLGLLEQAIKKYDIVIDLAKEDNPEQLIIALNNKGVCLMRLERWSDALTCFNEVLKIDPNHKEANKNKQKCLYELEHKPDAIGHQK